VKPAIVVLWILSIALAVGLTHLAGPKQDDVEPSLSGSLEKAFREFDPIRRPYLITRALQDLGPDDLPELIRVLEHQNMGIEPEEVELIMIAWTSFDAPGAYQWAIEGPKNWQTTLAKNAMYGWGFHDGREAIRVAEAIEEDSDFKEMMKQNALQGWLRGEDKDGVSEYIATFPDLKRRGRLFFLLAGEIVMSKGPEAAMRWVEGVDDDAPNNLKLGTFNHVAKMVASTDPERAAEWFLEHRTRPYSEGALAGVALRWVQNHDRPAAFEWLLAMSDDGLREGEREDAIAQGFRTWMQNGPNAAQEWLLAALPNPALEIAIRETIKRLLPTDPRSAMEWTRRLSDETKRNSESLRVGLRWRNRDPEAFGEWLKESDLPEETRQIILAAPQPPRRRPARLRAQPEPEQPESASGL
jgi:hypothetical protein